MKTFFNCIYKNWVLGIVVVVCFCVLLYSGMLRMCQSIISMVEFPADNHGLYFLSTGEVYFVGYDLEGELSILTQDMTEIFSAYDVKVAIPQGNIVHIKYEDGRETEVNVLTREIDEGGILL